MIKIFHYVVYNDRDVPLKEFRLLATKETAKAAGEAFVKERFYLSSKDYYITHECLGFFEVPIYSK